MLSDETQRIIDALDREFMGTEVAYFDDQEARDCCQPEFGDILDDDDDSDQSGYYARLSAPGYLDCTDWLGPFGTSDEAYEELAETYGDSVVIADEFGNTDYSCDQCDRVTITWGAMRGTVHERGCPNQHKIKRDNVWIRPEPEDDDEWIDDPSDD